MIYHLLQSYYQQPPRVTPIEAVSADKYELHFYLYQTAQNDLIVVIEGLGAGQPLSYIEERLNETLGLTVLGWFVNNPKKESNCEILAKSELSANDYNYIYRDGADPTLSPPYALVSVQ